jgi:small-conductance mechanosensitive channel
MRGIVWLISIFIIISELGFMKDLSSLITGLGLVSAIIALAAQELVKNLLSRSVNSY